MPSETKVQEIIHKLEEGGWAKWVWVAVLAGAVTYVSYLWLFKEAGFKGLTHPRAFEQAEISREIARGNGFSTRLIRPAELWLFKDGGREFPVERIPDTYHAPLWPTVLSPFVWLVRKSWPMTKGDIQYTSDRVIVSVALVFFLLSVVVNFITARRLFDLRLALLSMGLMLVCDQFWRFSMSGLPQMMMLFFFSIGLYCLVRIVEIYQIERLLEEMREAEERALARAEEVELQHSPAEATALPLSPVVPSAVPAGAVIDAAPAEVAALEEEGESEGEMLEVPSRFALIAWSVATGVAFGLLALTHAIGIWPLLGAIVFALVGLGHARWRVALPLIAATVLMYTPWMVRNYQVCGSPVGVSWYSGLQYLRGTEPFIMRSRESPVRGATPSMFRQKVQNGIVGQLGTLPSMLGLVLVAPVFFIALLHLFKRRSTAHFRWCALLMWLFAVFGMALFGFDDQSLKANDLHVLFIPIFTAYGLAYVLVLWSRLEINVRLLRIGFLVLIYLLCGGPFLLTLIDLHRPGGRQVEWPPYVPPIIALLGEWTNEREIIMSDMPWAVAWYADRRALWLPMTVKDFNEMNDYNLLKGSIVGLYLTPVSGNLPFLNEIIKGDYKEWAPFILRSGIPRNFPLRAVTVLPFDNMCTFYADRDRWTPHED